MALALAEVLKFISISVESFGKHGGMLILMKENSNYSQHVTNDSLKIFIVHRKSNMFGTRVFKLQI